jgi:hypothetical protein
VAKPPQYWCTADAYSILTPVSVAHNTLTEVFFSVWGEDARGNAMERPGPGGLRILRIEKPILVPNCALIPARLNVPDCTFSQPRAASAKQDRD